MDIYYCGTSHDGVLLPPINSASETMHGLNNLWKLGGLKSSLTVS